MPFKLPDQMPTDKVLTPSTMAVYKSRLNSLTKANEKWSDVPSLKKYAKSVIKHIDGLADDSAKGRIAKRGMVQSIFSVTDAKYRKKKNAYHTYWQTIMPGATADGGAWVSKKDYVEPSSGDI